MNEREFWGRPGRPRGMEDGRMDETESTTVEDRHIVAGPSGHGCLSEQPSRLPEDYETRYRETSGSHSLPDTNPKSQYGIKKVPTHSRIPWTAIILEGIVMALGGLKYGPFNWRKNSVAASVYVDAAERHLSLWNAGEDDDDESKVTHLAHVRACCGILIDAIETGNLVDDRPKNQATIDLIKRNYDVTNGTNAAKLS